MKKYLIILVMALTAAAANAQFRYGPIAGLTITDLKFEQNITKVSQVVGGQAGIQGELMFPGIGFGIDLGLIYNMAGADMDMGAKKIWSSQGYKGTERLMLHQLNIPFHLRFKYTRLNGVEDYIAPFVYGGPDFDILVGHSRCKAMEWAGGDFSLSVGGGAELWQHWQLSVQYTWGMTYCVKDAILTDYSAQNRQWTVRLAYLF